MESLEICCPAKDSEADQAQYAKREGKGGREIELVRKETLHLRVGREKEDNDEDISMERRGESYGDCESDEPAQPQPRLFWAATIHSKYHWR